MDIVIDSDGKPTGFLADDVMSYADAFEKILRMSEEEQMEIQRNARASVGRFSEEEFKRGFIDATEILIK